MTAEPYLPQVGHRARRTHVVEGVVTEIEEDFAYVNGQGWLTRSTRNKITWERLPDPEPTWRGGDAARDANGVVFVRNDDDEWQMPGRYANCEPTRPLTRLVPEVTS